MLIMDDESDDGLFASLKRRSKRNPLIWEVDSSTHLLVGTPIFENEPTPLKLLEIRECAVVSPQACAIAQLR